MKPTAALALAALAPGTALAQSTNNSTVTYTLTWQESDFNGVPVFNPNGELDPGEAALIHLSVSFTNQNSVATFSPPVGTFSSGTIRGFGAAFLDLVGGSGGANQGTWNLSHALGLGINPVWDITGQPPDIDPGGVALRNLQIAQFPISPPQIITTNPIIDVFRGVWIPSSYTIAEREFHLQAAIPSGGLSSSVLLRASDTIVLSAYTPAVYGHFTIPIPAPDGLALLALAALPAARRRR